MQRLKPITTDLPTLDLPLSLSLIAYYIFIYIYIKYIHNIFAKVHKTQKYSHVHAEDITNTIIPKEQLSCIIFQLGCGF